jgi:hypothetical protein
MYLYFISYDDRGAPSFDKFACSIGMTLADLMKLRARKKFSAAYRECCAIRRDYLIDRALDKRFDPSFVKQLLILEDGEEFEKEDLSAIEMNYEDTPANDEGRDAFFAAGTFIGGEAVGEVVLRRPFAQFNVGAEERFYENVELGGMYMDYSTVELKKVPTVFHPLTGEASAPKDIRFVVTETPANQTGDSLVVTIDEVNYTYRYLSMNYLLAHTEKTLFDAWTGMYGTPNVLVMGNQVLNVPLQRNYRTNLLYFYKGGGDTIVDMVDGTFIIVVDPNFTSEHNKKK